MNSTQLNSFTPISDNIYIYIYIYTCIFTPLSDNQAKRRKITLQMIFWFKVWKGALFCSLDVPPLPHTHTHTHTLNQPVGIRTKAEKDEVAVYTICYIYHDDLYYSFGNNIILLGILHIISQRNGRFDKNSEASINKNCRHFYTIPYAIFL